MTQLRRFLLQAPSHEVKAIFALASLSGLANAFILVIVNRVAGAVATNVTVPWSAYLAYAVAYPLFFLPSRKALIRANTLIEGLLRDLRLRIAEKVRRSELAAVESQKRGELYALVSQETNHLSLVFPVLVNVLGQLVALAAALCYIAYLSFAALILILLCVAGGCYAVSQSSRTFQQAQLALVTRQAQLGDALSHIVDGFKELRLHRGKSRSVLRAFSQTSAEATADLARVSEQFVQFSMGSAVVLYSALGVLAFLFPQYLSEQDDVVFRLTAAVLFCVGPITALMGLLPMAIQAEVGLQALESLEMRLDAGRGAEPARAAELGQALLPFRKVEYRDVSYAYHDDEGRETFRVGPLNLGLAAGEVLFLVGGNGAGKTTTVRLMTGLYPPAQGTVRVNGRALTPDSAPGLRELFSAVLTDFHLFESLYGLEEAAAERMQELLAMVELSDKVTYRDGRFSTLSLSTGQRKRLALVVALLEDRPIVVFDEWAADQDVRFRERFYTEILPDLKRRGKAVLAVTHDDRYWPLADRVVKMDLGSFEPETAPPR